MTARERIARTALAAVLAVTLGLAGCARQENTSPTGAGSGATSAPTAPQAEPAPVTIGILTTEDSLPLWVAENMGYFATQGIASAKLVTFETVQERDAAFVSGSIDAFAGDIVASARLEAEGAPNTIKTIMLGANQSQGRFAVVVPPQSDVSSLDQLKGVPVGASSATVEGYVLDGLMAEAGVSATDVKSQEVKKVEPGYAQLMGGKLKAAVLPETFVSLAEQNKAKVVGDDTKAKKNLSQTVLVFSDKYLAKPEGRAAADAVLGAWDVSAQQINREPNAYRRVLLEKGALPKALEGSYQVNTYPSASLPTAADVDPLLEWMRGKGYLKADVTYADLTQAPK